MSVHKLALKESACLEPSAFTGLWTELGKREADQMLNRAMDELIDRLETMRQALNDKDHKQLSRLARDLHQVTGALGLKKISACAKSVAELAAVGAVTALVPVTLRMIRLGEATVAEMWTIQSAQS